MKRHNIDKLRDLLERIERPEGPDQRLDAELSCALTFQEHYTRSLDEMARLIAEELPGWWHASGLCALSGHASIGPDYEGPEGERLRAEFPIDAFDGGFHADLEPGDGIHRQCRALLFCVLQALIALIVEDADYAHRIAGLSESEEG